MVQLMINNRLRYLYLKYQISQCLTLFIKVLITITRGGLVIKLTTKELKYDIIVNKIMSLEFRNY